MDIVIIGSGNVATVLGRKFKAAGHSIAQVYSKNAATATQLANELNTVSTNDKKQLFKSAAIYLIAVNDNAIDDVVKELQLPGNIIAHTAASVSMEVLKSVSKHYGVFYPLQSLHKEMKALPDVPILLDGSDAQTINSLEKLAHSISPDNVGQADDDERLKLHVAAVVVNNFVNHLYVLVEEFCKNEKLDFMKLFPLIEETASRLKSSSSKALQTGPAIRHDNESIHKHLDLLKSHPQLKNLYVLLTESIQQSK